MSEVRLGIRIVADSNGALRAIDDTNQQIGRLGTSAGNSSRGISSMNQSMRSAAGLAARLAAGLISITAVKKIITTADNMQQLAARVRLATKETGDFVSVYQSLEGQSLAIGGALESNVALFQSLARTAPELKATSTEILNLTDNVQKLAAVSGAGPEAMKNAMTQFSQGMAGGILRAEEFNSIIENTPAIASAIADGMGLTVGKLRLAVVDGKVLSQDVFRALLSQTEQINADFDQMPLSLGRVKNSTNLAFADFIAEANEATDGVNALTEGIQRFANYVYGLDGAEFVQPFVNLDLIIVSGIATAEKLQVTFTSVFSIVKETVIAKFKGMVESAMTLLADMAQGMSDMASAVGLDSLSRSLSLFSSDMRPAINAADELKVKLDAIVKADKAAKAAIDDNVVSMFVQRNEMNAQAVALKNQAQARKELNSISAAAETEKNTTSEKVYTQALKEGEQLRKASLTALESYIEKTAKLSTLYNQNAISLETFNRTLAKYQDALNTVDTSGIKDELKSVDDYLNEITNADYSINLNIAGDDFGAVIESMVNGLSKIGNISKEFGVVVKHREAITDAIKGERKELKKLDKGTEAYMKQQKKIGKLTDDRTELNDRANQLEIDGYLQAGSAMANMFSSMSSMMAENSTEQKAFAVAAIAAQTAMAVVSGVQAILAQGTGDPYSAFARIAAMIGIVGAVLGGIGASIGAVGGMGGGGGPPKLQETQGTGTVLGDASAVSESIENSIDNLSDLTSIELTHTSRMLFHLKSIDEGINSFGSSIVRGDGMTGFNESVNLASTVTPSEMENQIETIAGVLLGPLIGKLLGGLFGDRSKVNDSGVEFDKDQTFGSIKSDGVDAGYFAQIKHFKKIFGFKTGTYTEELFSEMDETAASGFTNLITHASLALSEAMSVISGRTSESIDLIINDMALGIDKISLKDLSSEDALIAINGVFSAWLDETAKGIAGKLDLTEPIELFQKEGEGLLETVVRMASSIEQADFVLNQFGFSAGNYADVQYKQGDISEQLVRDSILLNTEFQNIRDIMQYVTGDAEELVSVYKDLLETQRQLIIAGQGGNVNISDLQTGFGGDASGALSEFNDYFLSDAERLDGMISTLSSAFTKAGVEIPKTKDEFVDLFNSLGDVGKGRLLGFQYLWIETFDLLESVAEEAASGIEQAIADIQRYVDSLLVNNSLSTLTNKGRLDESRNQFSEQLALAQSGDLDALNSLTSFTDEYLGEAKSYFASSGDYAAIFDQVTSSLTALDTSSVRTIDEQIVDATKATANTALDMLSVLKETRDSQKQYYDQSAPVPVNNRGAIPVTIKSHNDNSEISKEVIELLKQLIADSKESALSVVMSNYDANQKNSDDIIDAMESTRATKVEVS